MSRLIDRILAALIETGHPLSPQDLATRLGVKVSSVFGSLSSSVSQGEYALVKPKWDRNSAFIPTDYGRRTTTGSFEPHEITEAREEIEFHETLILRAERRIEAAVRAHVIARLGEQYADRDLSHSFAHDCPGPINICVYDLDEDPCEDHCLFGCGPRERK